MKSAISYKGAIYTKAALKDFDVDKATELLDNVEEEMKELDRMFKSVGGLTYERWEKYPFRAIMTMLKNQPGLTKQTFTVDGLITEVEEDQKDAEAGEDDDKE